MDLWVAQLETIPLGHTNASVPFNLSSMLALLHRQLLTLSPSTQTHLQRTLHWSVSPPHMSRCSYIDCSYKSRNPSHHIAPTWIMLCKGCSCPNAPEGHTMVSWYFLLNLKRHWFCTYSGHHTSSDILMVQHGLPGLPRSNFRSNSRSHVATKIRLSHLQMLIMAAIPTTKSLRGCWGQRTLPQEHTNK